MNGQLILICILAFLRFPSFPKGLKEHLICVEALKISVQTFVRGKHDDADVFNVFDYILISANISIFSLHASQPKRLRLKVWQRLKGWRRWREETRALNIADQKANLKDT